MDTISNYPSFRTDIKQAFRKIIDEFNFEFNEIYDGCYELGNQYSLLRFTYDRGDVNCSVRKVGEPGFGHGILSIFRYLHPIYQITDDKTTIHDPYKQLQNLSAIIEKHFIKTLVGDFSWIEGYLRYQEKESKMIGFIWEKIDSENPIYKKFKAGDLSWQKDLEDYLKSNHISL